MNRLSGGWIIAAAAAAIFVVDLLIPLGTVVPMLYVIPIIISLFLPIQASTLLIVCSILSLTWLGAAFSPGEMMPDVIINRVLASVLLLVVALLLLLHKQSGSVDHGGTTGEGRREERLQLAQTGANIGMFDWNIPAHKVVWSSEMEQIWGLPVGGFEGTYEHWRRLIHPDDVAEAKRMVRLALENPDIAYSYDHRIVRPDGTVRWIHAKATTVRDPAGRPVRMVGVNLDITDRKKVEESLRQLTETLEDQVGERTAALRKSEERFRAFTRATNEVVYRMSPDWTEMRYLQGREFIADTLEPSRTWLDKYIPPDEQPRVSHTIQQTIQSKSLFELEHRVIRVDGSHGWTYSRAIPILDDHGEIMEWFGAASEITQHKQAELKLQASETFVIGVLDSLSSHVCVLNEDGVIIRTNKAWKQFARANSDPSVTIGAEGDNYLDVCRRAIVNGDATVEPILSGVEAVLAGKQQAFSAEYPCHSPDEKRWFLLRVSPLMDTPGVVLSHLDITDRKCVEENLLLKQQELERAQTKLQDLALKLMVAQDGECRRIARELHDDHLQQLAALALDLHRLSRSLPTTPAEEAKAPIAQYARSVERLATNLQQFTHQLHPSMLSHLGLEATLYEHVEEFERRTGMKTKVEMRRLLVKLSDKQALCLFRVLQECLQNVRKHADATKVLVRLLGTGNGVGLCVRDDGRGFDAVQECGGKTNGLGLISMRERLDALYGTFRLRTKPGDGTEVHAWIPLEHDEVLVKEGS